MKFIERVKYRWKQVKEMKEASDDFKKEVAKKALAVRRKSYTEQVLVNAMAEGMNLANAPSKKDRLKKIAAAIQNVKVGNPQSMFPEKGKETKKVDIMKPTEGLWDKTEKNDERRASYFG